MKIPLQRLLFNGMKATNLWLEKTQKLVMLHWTESIDTQLDQVGKIQVIDTCLEIKLDVNCYLVYEDAVDGLKGCWKSWAALMFCRQELRHRTWSKDAYPPCFTKRALSFETSSAGETPVLSTLSVYTSETPSKATLTGLNSLTMISSTSSAVRIPSSINACKHTQQM